MKTILKKGAFFLMNASWKIFLIAAIAYAIGVYQNSYTFVPDYPRLMAPALRITFKIYDDSNNLRGTGGGSATIIEQRRNTNGVWNVCALTNKHVVMSAENIRARGYVVGPLMVTWWYYPKDPHSPLSEFSREAKVKRVWDKHDLALVCFESREPFPVAPIARTPAIEGDWVCAVGSPILIPTVVTCERMSIRRHLFPKMTTNDNGELVDVYLLMAPAPVWGGSSGGALYNHKYEIVGVTVLRGETGHLAFFVPLQEIIEFLEFDDPRNGIPIPVSRPSR